MCITWTFFENRSATCARLYARTVHVRVVIIIIITTVVAVIIVRTAVSAIEHAIRPQNRRRHEKCMPRIIFVNGRRRVARKRDYGEHRTCLKTNVYPRGCDKPAGGREKNKNRPVPPAVPSTCIMHERARRPLVDGIGRFGHWTENENED